MVRKIIEFILGLGISFILDWITQKILSSANINSNHYIASGLIIIVLSGLVYLFLRNKYIFVARGVLVGAGLLILGMLFVNKINSTYWG